MKKGQKIITPKKELVKKVIKKKKKVKSKKFVNNSKKLLVDLILSEDEKNEIESVLKQFGNATKIFDTWGLNDTIPYGKGMTFLFYGKPGTGKTFAAHVISKIMKCELLTINAGQIQTSEPGGANRNIQQAFQSAKDSKKILLFDECDSLITQRNNVGMILGSEINTLLTEIERFEGILILTTNREETLDEALERRISLIIEFPEPNYELREKIWHKLIPSKFPLDKKVKISKLAEYKLTGGQIKNVVLQSARFAAVENSRTIKYKYFIKSINRIQKSQMLLGTASQPRAKIRRDSFEEKELIEKVEETVVETVTPVKDKKKGKRI